MPTGPRRWPAVVLWLLVLGAIGAGAATWSSFGQGLVLFGLLLAALVPLRREPRTFWPLAIGLVVFAAGYAVTAPINCRTGAAAGVDGGQGPARFCDTLAGFGYDRPGAEDPSTVPAFGGSLGAGLLVAGVAWLVMRPRRRKARPEAAAEPPRVADRE